MRLGFANKKYTNSEVDKLFEDFKDLTLDEKVKMKKFYENELQILSKKSSKYARRIFDDVYTIKYLEHTDVEEIKALKKGFVHLTIINGLLAVGYGLACVGTGNANFKTLDESCAVFALLEGLVGLYTALYGYEPVLYHARNEKLTKMNESERNLKTLLNKMDKNLQECGNEIAN